MKPKVTIGICVRNSESFIEEAIDSIINQDYQHELMEVILVDDGSTDRTLQVILFAIPKMKMGVKVFHQRWKGLGATRNTVVDNARGDYIVWVDGDMILSHDYIRKLVEFMDENLDVGIAKGKYELTPGDNWLSTLEIYSRAASKMVDFNCGAKAYSRSLGTGGSIYRIEALKQIRGFDENLRGYGEDWDAECRIRKTGWSFYTTNVQFRDYERRGITWNDLWYRNVKRGYGLHNFLEKNRGMINLYKMLPPAAFLSGLFHALTIYKLTHRKIVFLLPLQYIFKASALWLGYIKSHRAVSRRHVMQQSLDVKF